MDTLTSKSTFYDTVSMIVPGFIMLFSISKIFGIGKHYFSDTAWAVPLYLCIFAMSYLVGLLIHRISQRCFDRWLRNNPQHITAAKEKLEGEIKVREDESMQETTNKIVEDYYENYYEVIEHSPSIPTMEAQVSFIRSMLVVFAIIIVALGISFINLDCFIDWISSYKKFVVIILLAVLFVFLTILIFSIQKKIYFRVFEDSHYINKLKEKSINIKNEVNNPNKS